MWASSGTWPRLDWALSCALFLAFLFMLSQLVSFYWKLRSRKHLLEWLSIVLRSQRSKDLEILDTIAIRKEGHRATERAPTRAS
jgi:hypothetical protein